MAHVVKSLWACRLHTFTSSALILDITTVRVVNSKNVTLSCRTCNINIQLYVITMLSYFFLCICFIPTAIRNNILYRLHHSSKTQCVLLMIEYYMQSCIVDNEVTTTVEITVNNGESWIRWHISQTCNRLCYYNTLNYNILVILIQKSVK